MTVAELKEKLQDVIDDLEMYDEDQEVNVSCNTYGLGSNFLATYEGFIDLSRPVKRTDEEDW